MSEPGDLAAVLRAGVGRTFGPARPPHNRVATTDAFRHFAWATGSDDPLHVDPAHAVATRWGDVIAPPFYFETMGEAREPDEAAVAASVLPLDRPMVLGRTETRWFRPLQPGARVVEHARLLTVEERSSARSGATVAARYRHVFTEAGTEQLLVSSDRWFVFRVGPGEATPGPKAPASAEQDRLPPGPPLPGPPAFEDLAAGRRLPGWRHGPVTIADIVAFHVGWGAGGPFPWGTGRVGLAASDAHPSWFARGATGAREVAVRVHWDPEAAGRAGGRPHLYGQQQASFVANHVRELVGDSGWLARLLVVHRRATSVGDDLVLSGAVTAVRPPHEVDVELQVRDQRGRTSVTATATLLLASRAAGAPPLPVVPDDVFAVVSGG